MNNSVHSYSQLILLPWGYTDSPPADYDVMYELAMKGSDALTATHGKFYEVNRTIGFGSGRDRLSKAEAMVVPRLVKFCSANAVF